MYPPMLEGQVMQKIGEVCINCKKHWEEQHKPVRVLRRAPGTTMNKKMLVPVCDWCDGDLMFEHKQGVEV
jgi:hypothetical protein